MSIIERTTKLELTQYSGSSVKAQFYANYNSDMQKIDGGYATLDEAINGEEGLGARVSALETSITAIDEKADNAVSTANDAKTTAEGFDTRVTTLEGKVSDLETWAGGVDTTLEAYDGRLDAIEDVIATVSTANINDLIARMDALEQKVDANTQSIDTLNDNLISAVNRIVDLETGLGTTNANLNALAGRVTLLEDCCEEVRTTLADHNTRINKNASDISALDARLTRDETNIAGNASDIVILATQNNTQAEQIDDLYSKYNALDPTSPTNLYSRVQTLEDVVGDTPLHTVAQTVTGAINELFGHATDVDADEVDYDNTNSQLVATDVQGAIDEVVGTIGTDEARIEALETTVGGAGSGLVKDVGDLQTSVGTLEITVGDSNAGLVKDVADLGTTVGDASAGLVKDVADLQTTVGDATAGLVKDVADLGTTVGDASAGLVKDVDDLQTTVGDASAGLVKAVTDIQEIIPSNASSVNKLLPRTGISYSTSEFDTGGKWIDGKPIYRKVIECGALPDATTKRVATGVSNVDTLISLKGMAYAPAAIIPLPFTDLQNIAQQIRIYYETSGSSIALSTAGNFSTTYPNTIAIIEYTKTTD